MKNIVILGKNVKDLITHYQLALTKETYDATTASRALILVSGNFMNFKILSQSALTCCGIYRLRKRCYSITLNIL